MFITIKGIHKKVIRKTFLNLVCNSSFVFKKWLA